MLPRRSHDISRLALYETRVQKKRKELVARLPSETAPASASSAQGIS